MGDLDFIAPLDGDTATYDGGEALWGSRYRLDLRFEDGRLTATEAGDPPFGLGVYFAEIYRRP